jgi:hypothetical protein
MLVANGDEPVEWELPDDLWEATKRAAEERQPIDAGDTFTAVGDMSLLGTPVDLVGIGTPALRYRSNGEIRSTPIVGSMEER